MKIINGLLTYDLFWIPLIFGGTIATLLFGFLGSGQESLFGLGSFLDALIGIILIVIGVLVLAKMPGAFLKWPIGFGLLGFGLYILINVMGVMWMKLRYWIAIVIGAILVISAFVYVLTPALKI